MNDLTVVCWKWNQKNYRTQFTANHVNTLKNMVERNLKIPYRFVCVTDDSNGIECETIPLWESPNIIGIPEGKPNCYRRLKAFSKDAKDIFGTDRILSIDLDTVIVSDITPLVDTTRDFTIWGDTSLTTYYNGSFWLLKCGSRAQVWETIHSESYIETQKKRFIGSDQAWISNVLGPKEKKWTCADGVYSFKNHIKKQRKVDLPQNARIVFFHGIHDPSDIEIQETYTWVKTHYK